MLRDNIRFDPSDNFSAELVPIFLRHNSYLLVCGDHVGGDVSFYSENLNCWRWRKYRLRVFSQAIVA